MYHESKNLATNEFLNFPQKKSIAKNYQAWCQNSKTMQDTCFETPHHQSPCSVTSNPGIMLTHTAEIEQRISDDIWGRSRLHFWAVNCKKMLKDSRIPVAGQALLLGQIHPQNTKPIDANTHVCIKQLMRCYPLFYRAYYLPLQPILWWLRTP